MIICKILYLLTNKCFIFIINCSIFSSLSLLDFFHKSLMPPILVNGLGETIRSQQLSLSSEANSTMSDLCFFYQSRTLLNDLPIWTAMQCVKITNKSQGFPIYLPPLVTFLVLEWYKEKSNISVFLFTFRYIIYRY